MRASHLLRILGAIALAGVAATASPVGPADARPEPGPTQRVHGDQAMQRVIVVPRDSAADRALRASTNRMNPQQVDGADPVGSGRAHTPPARDDNAPYRDSDAPAPSTAPLDATRVAAALRRAADQPDDGLRAALAQAVADGDATRLTPLWINGTFALEASASLVAALDARSDVAAVLPDRPLALASAGAPRAVRAGAAGVLMPALTALALPGQSNEAVPVATDPTWSVSAVRAPETWRRLGVDGSGVVVAVLDSGVDYNHPALRTRYRGYRGEGRPDNTNSWWCRSCGNSNIYPYDSAGQAGHGTHVAGSILGGEGFGVAPGAEWIAARACDGTDCSDSTLLAAFQWVLDLGPAAPEVVNTSLVTILDTSTALITPAVEAVEAAGILLVGSTGNDEGPITAPGGLASALGVGATTAAGEMWIKSRWGTSPFGDNKPDVVAPGAGIESAMPGGGMIRQTGTSMAAPHVAGVAALILSAAPDLRPAEVRAVITRTARTLSTSAPNPKSGWGLVDAYGAVKSVSEVGSVTGRVVRTEDGVAIPDAVVRVTDIVRDPVARLTVDSDGRFDIDLRPGSYVLFIEAFGYVSVTRPDIDITADGQIDLGDIALAVETPRGTFSGRLIDGENGAPVTGTLRIEGAPRPLPTDELGFFSVQLPARTYQVDVAELGYRALRDSVKVVAGQTVTRTYRMVPAPRVLLVDGDAWAYGRAAAVIGDSLTRLRYVFDRHHVTDDVGGPGRPGGAPDLATLAGYDLVLWSSAVAGPAHVRGAGALSAYLEQGGKLLLSGQDALCVDAGVDTGRRPCDDRARPHPYVRDRLHLRVVADASASRIVHGLDSGPLAGITLTLNGPGSLDNQDATDVLASIDDLHTDLIARYDNGGGAAALVARCESHRSVALGFGIEGIAGDEVRDVVVARLMDALVAPEPAHAAFVRPVVDTLIRAPGRTADFTVTLTSTGVEATTFDLDVDGSTGWPAELRTAGFGEVLTEPLVLEHCASAVFGARVQVPADALPGAANAPELRIRAREGASVSLSLPLKARAPAPLLLVDGEFQSETRDAWSAALDELGLVHDLWALGEENPSWEARPPDGQRPPDEALSLYPAVLWFVGYDFRDHGNLGSAGQKALAAYLDQGGRLLLSSEDFLWARGETPFAGERRFHREYLGVTGYEDNAGAAHQGPLTGAEASIYEGLRGCMLDRRDVDEDRSDRLELKASGRPALLDIFDHPVAAQFAGRDFRTVFLGLDAGRGDPACLQPLLASAVAWFAPLADSELLLVDATGRQTDRRAYGDGDTVRLELVVRPAVARDVAGAEIRWSLPEGASPLTGTLPSGWTWSEAERTLNWQGDVQRGRPLRAVVALRIDPGAPAPGAMVSEAVLIGEGLAASTRVGWRVNAPDLSSASKSVGRPNEPFAYGSEVSFFLNVRNNGTRAADPFLVTDTLPAGLMLVPESWIITAGAGEVTGDPDQGRLHWRGVIPPGGLAALSYRARVVTHEGGPRTNIAVVDDGTGERRSLTASVFVSPRLLLPWVASEIDTDP